MKLFLPLTAALVAPAALCSGAVLYTTDFGTGYTSGTLVGQSGWAQTGTTTTNPIQVTGAAAVVGPTGQDVNHLYTATVLSGVTPTITLEASITINTNGNTAGDYFLHLGDGGTANFYLRLYARSAGAGLFNLAMTTSSGAVLAGSWGGNLTVGSTYAITMAYNFVSGLANDTGSLLVNGAAYSTAQTSGVDSVSFSSVNLRQGGGASAPNVTVDNIVVSSVPEPNAAALLGSIGVLGLVRRRR